MSINLRGGDTFMPEHNLHETQIMGFADKMGSTGVSEAVRCNMHFFAQAGGYHFMQGQTDTARAQHFTATTNKQMVGSDIDRRRRTLFQVGTNAFGYGVGYRYWRVRCPLPITRI